MKRSSFFREKISERIKHTPRLKRSLETVVEHSLGEHKLLKCQVCGQHWQLSRAWNWGNYKYVFKVPNIEADEWSSEPYVQPDELLIYSAVMQDYLNKNIFVETDRECRSDDCDEEPKGKELPEYA